MQTLLLLAAFQGPVAAPAAPAESPRASAPLDVAAKRREFDFWLGSWRVLNRHLQDDGTWKDGPVGKARITPILGGHAVLEEWGCDMTWGGHLNGFSLRAYDPGLDRWNLLLYWHANGRSSFGQLDGRFRHGRGEFFSRSPNDAGGETITRYSFSDALSDTVRWDEAFSTDGGVHWKTDWIMEFTRTEPASAVTEERAFTEVFEEGEITGSPECRQRDAFVGSWQGELEVPGVESGKARLRVRPILKGGAHIELLEVSVGGGPWEPAFTVRAFSAGRRAWEAWTLVRDRTVAVQSLAEAGSGGRSFVGDSGTRREHWTLAGGDRLEIVVERRDGDGPWRAARSYSLARE